MFVHAQLFCAGPIPCSFLGAQRKGGGTFAGYADRSDVLGNAVEAGSRSALIQFSDREIESSRVVNSFLLLATCDELTPAKSLQGAEFCSEMEALIRFMDKYGCRRVMTQFKLCLLGHLELSRIDPMMTFAIGSAAGDNYVCIKALETAAQAASNRITFPSESTDAHSKSFRTLAHWTQASCRTIWHTSSSPLTLGLLTEHGHSV